MMDNIKLLALLPGLLFLAACSSFPTTGSPNWMGYNFNNESVNSILTPSGATPPANYQAPRQYHVTAQDQEEYDAISQRVQQRQQQLQGVPSSSMVNSAAGMNYTSKNTAIPEIDNTTQPNSTNNSTLPAPIVPNQGNTMY